MMSLKEGCYWKNLRNKVRHSPVFILLILIFWFIIRVGTRPSRVLYPCQITILHQTLMSVQVFLASSTNTFIIFWRRLFYSKIFWGTSVIVGLFILGIILGAKGVRFF
jgi:hypothetical protein